MNTGWSDHISADALEAYAMGKLSLNESVPLEEHLLICSQCQTRLEQTDEYIQVIQAAASDLSRRPASNLRRFLPELKSVAPIARSAPLIVNAATLLNSACGFTTMTVLGVHCVFSAWTWYGDGRLAYRFPPA